MLNCPWLIPVVAQPDATRAAIAAGAAARTRARAIPFIATSFLPAFTIAISLTFPFIGTKRTGTLERSLSSRSVFS